MLGALEKEVVGVWILALVAILWNQVRKQTAWAVSVWHRVGAVFPHRGSWGRGGRNIGVL